MSRVSQRKLGKETRSIHCYPRLLAMDVRKGTKVKEEVNI